MFIEEFLPRLKSNTREYAVATSILALLIMSWGTSKRKWTRISSAIADIRQW